MCSGMLMRSPGSEVISWMVRPASGPGSTIGVRSIKVCGVRRAYSCCSSGGGRGSSVRSGGSNRDSVLLLLLLEPV